MAKSLQLKEIIYNPSLAFYSYYKDQSGRLRINKNIKPSFQNIKKSVNTIIDKEFPNVPKIAREQLINKLYKLIEMDQSIHTNNYTNFLKKYLSIMNEINQIFHKIETSYTALKSAQLRAL